MLFGDKMSLKEKVKKIRLIGTDIDGVWTDGTMYYSPNGDFMKAFSTYDGMAVQIIKDAGFDIVIMTGENSEMVKKRAEKLNIDKVYLGEKEKLKRLKYICSRFEYELDEVAYIGDDINDFEIMPKVGFSWTPNDGIKKIKDISDYVCTAKGGHGAFREVSDLILKFY